MLLLSICNTLHATHPQVQQRHRRHRQAPRHVHQRLSPITYTTPRCSPRHRRRSPLCHPRHHPHHAALLRSLRPFPKQRSRNQTPRLRVEVPAVQHRE